MTTVAAKRAELLRRQIVGCTKCGLHLTCRSPVPPRIPSTAITPELLLIGEAPGSQEDREGEPFVGPAGNLLFKWLKIEMGLSRAQVMIGNSISCQPTVNDAGKKNRQPSKSELAACRDNLAKTLAYYLKAGGKWILLAGSTALQSFVAEARIGQWAGRPFVMKHETGLVNAGLVNVMPTYHPAAALRDMRHAPTIRRHLNLMATLKRDLSTWPETCFCGKEAARFDAMGVPWCAAHEVYGRGVLRVPRVSAAQEKLAV